MKMRLAPFLCSAVLASTFCLSKPVIAAAPAADHLTFIVINDTYRAENFAYLRTLRAQLEKTEGHVLVLHAGDFLFPSLLSQRYNGEQMIDVMNMMDGNEQAFDPYMFITFGNHEFEKDKMKHVGMLQSRIDESQFDWVGSNIHFKTGDNGQPVIQSKNLVDDALVEVNGVKVGIVSATTQTKTAEFIENFAPTHEVIGRLTRELRGKGARLVIAITHQRVSEDEEMLSTLGKDAPDLVAGGHEHERHLKQVDGHALVKADSDVKSAAIVKVQLTPDGPKFVTHYVDFPGKLSPDLKIQQRVADWTARFGKEYCIEKHAAENCMQEVLGKTQVDLMGEELMIRRFETNLGDLLADTAKTSFLQQGAQIAFLNSGGMRLNYNIPAGPISRTHVDSLFAFPTPLSLIKITGAQLQTVVDHAITDWTGNGRWLQISGFSFRHNPQTGKADKLSLMTPNGPRLIQPEDTLLAVTNNYLLDASGDQDGYRMLSDKMKVEPNAPGVELKDKLIEALKAAGNKGVSPHVDHRICNTDKNKGC